MELARLGLVVDGTGAVRTLNSFRASSDRATKSATATERATRTLTRALVGLSAYFGVRELINYADTWTLLESRIRIVTDSEEQHAAAMSEVYRIAQSTRNSLGATATLYQRVAINADQLGRSHRELLDMVEAVNNGMLISGATGVEAAQSIRQLAQALGAGRLQGDEFRTMMEAMPEISRAVSKEMGVTTGELYKLSAEGKITANTLITALLKQRESFAESAKQIPMTMGQSLQYLRNAGVRTVGILSQITSTGKGVAQSMVWVADNLDKVIAGIIAATSAWIAYQVAIRTAAAYTAVITSVQTIAGFISLAKTIRSAADAMALMSMVGKGVVGAIAAIAAATIGYIAYQKMLDKINEATELWAGNLDVLNNVIGNNVDKIDEMTAAEKKALDQRWANEDMIRLAEQQLSLAYLQADAQERLAIEYDAVNKSIEARRELTGGLLTETLAAIQAEKELALQTQTVESAMDRANEAIENQKAILKNFAENVQRSFGDLFYNIMNNGINSFKDLFGGVLQMFYRMIAEMMAAKMMKKLGGTLATALAAVLGTAATAVAMPVPIANTTTSVAEAAASGGTVAVQIEGITVTASKSWAAQFATYLGPILAGFGVGTMIGGMTSNKALGTAGGAVGGAIAGAIMGSIVPGVGTVVGAVLGGVFGAIGGLFGATKRANELMEEHLAILEGNNRRLEALRIAVEGANPSRYSQALSATRRGMTGGLENLSAEELLTLTRVSAEVGIQLFDENGKLVAGTLGQLEEALELTIRSLTEFGNSLEEQRSRQDTYNKLFDVNMTNQQRLEDEYNILMGMAPDLMALLGLDKVDLTTSEGRAIFLEGLRTIFMMIENGLMTTELLGAFADKNQLIDAILGAKDGLDAFKETLSQVTTDFPRAMDIIFYEQKYGTYSGSKTSGNGMRPDDPNDKNGMTIYGNVTFELVVGPNDDGEAILRRAERAANDRRSRGGVVEVQEASAR